jgi:hypothetical protein
VSARDRASGILRREQHGENHGKNPVVELDRRDDPHRLGLIKVKLILPFLDTGLKYDDRGIEYCDKADDQNAVNAGHATPSNAVGASAQ